MCSGYNTGKLSYTNSHSVHVNSPNHVYSSEQPSLMHKITDQITDSMYLNVFQACNVYNIVHIFAFVLRATCDLLTFQNFSKL